MSSTPTRHQPPASSKSKSAPSQDLLYNPLIPSLSHAESARTLCARAASATLCTLNDTGFPYGSLVLFALSPHGRPALLISELAEHTRNLRRDSRCSLLVAEDGRGNPLARGRVTLVGNAVVEDRAIGDGMKAFLAKNPAAKRYSDFADFAVWRIDVEAVRYIGGFGRMSFVDAAAWSEARPDALAVRGVGMEQLIEALNEPHRVKQLAEVVQHFSLATSVSAVRVQKIDQYGFEVDADTEHGPRPIRVAYERTAESVDDADALIRDLEKIAVA